MLSAENAPGPATERFHEKPRTNVPSLALAIDSVRGTEALPFRDQTELEGA